MASIKTYSVKPVHQNAKSMKCSFSDTVIKQKEKKSNSVFSDALCRISDPVTDNEKYLLITQHCSSLIYSSLQSDSNESGLSVHS